MSAICGIIELSGKVPNFDELKKMGRGMSFRSRGDFGAYLGKGVGIIQRGESKNGELPFIASRGGYAYVVAFDGELQNISCICSVAGIFDGSSDEEIILESYLSDGLDLLGFLEGGYAFCLYDSHRNQVILSRDARGGKPLYYYYDKERLYFASEIKSLLTVEGIGRTVDVAMLERHILGEEGIGGRIYKYIKELGAGECISVTGFGVKRFPLGSGSINENAPCTCGGSFKADYIPSLEELLLGLLIAYDYPSFDMAIPYQILEINKKNAVYIPNGANVSDGERKYFYERADRLIYLLDGISDKKNADIREKPRTPKQLERELCDLFERMVGENRGNILRIMKLFECDIRTELKKEKNIARRIGIRGRLCQLCMWSELYSPTFERSESFT